MKKNNRQALIKQLILQHDIETQDELIELLEDQGVKATQATVSRDIRELSVVKTRAKNGNVKYTIFTQSAVSDEEKLKESVRDSVIKIQQVQFVNVVHTTLGTANVVAAVIDELNYPEIAGTLAGADTIVIFSPDEPSAKKMNQLIADSIV